MINEVEKLLDMENPTTRLNWMGWDKGGFIEFHLEK
jgi:hypothetical protein